MFSELAEHLPDDFAMTGGVRMRDEDVVEVDHDISRQNEVLEDVVHHCLEGGQGVGKAEVHHQWLKEPLVSMESGLPFVTFLDPDIVETPPDVEFREEPGSLQMVNEIVDQRERVPIFHGHCVKCLVVLDKPEGTILLLNKEDW
jgi:hypothetical protein